MNDPYILYSSDGLGRGDVYYSVTKFRDSIRKQWALTIHTPGVMDIAAYFRSEQHARQFAKTFSLTFTQEYYD